MCSFSEGKAGQEHSYEAETSVAQSASQRSQSHPRCVQQVLFKVQMIIKNSWKLFLSFKPLRKWYFFICVRPTPPL